MKLFIGSYEKWDDLVNEKQPLGPEEYDLVIYIWEYSEKFGILRNRFGGTGDNIDIGDLPNVLLHPEGSIKTMTFWNYKHSDRKVR